MATASLFPMRTRTSHPTSRLRNNQAWWQLPSPPKSHAKLLAWTRRQAVRSCVHAKANGTTTATTSQSIECTEANRLSHIRLHSLISLRRSHTRTSPLPMNLGWAADMTMSSLKKNLIATVPDATMTPRTTVGGLRRTPMPFTHSSVAKSAVNSCVIAKDEDAS